MWLYLFNYLGVGANQSHPIMKNMKKMIHKIARLTRNTAKGARKGRQPRAVQFVLHEQVLGGEYRYQVTIKFSGGATKLLITEPCSVAGFAPVKVVAISIYRDGFATFDSNRLWLLNDETAFAIAIAKALSVPLKPW